MLFFVTNEPFIDVLVELCHFALIVVNALGYCSLAYIYLCHILSYELDLFFECILQGLGGGNAVDFMLKRGEFMGEVFFVGLSDCYNFIIERYDGIFELGYFLSGFFICVFHIELKIVIFLLVDAFDSFEF